MGIAELLSFVAGTPGGLARLPVREVPRPTGSLHGGGMQQLLLSPDDATLDCFREYYRCTKPLYYFDYILIDGTNLLHTRNLPYLVQLLLSPFMCYRRVLIFFDSCRQGPGGTAPHNGGLGKMHSIKHQHKLGFTGRATVGNDGASVTTSVLSLSQLRDYYAALDPLVGAQSAHAATRMDSPFAIAATCQLIAQAIARRNALALATEQTSKDTCRPEMIELYLSDRDAPGEADYKLLHAHRVLVAAHANAGSGDLGSPNNRALLASLGALDRGIVRGTSQAATNHLPYFLFVSEDSDLLCGALLGPAAATITIATRLKERIGMQFYLLSVSKVLTWLASHIQGQAEVRAETITEAAQEERRHRCPGPMEGAGKRTTFDSDEEADASSKTEPGSSSIPSVARAVDDENAPTAPPVYPAIPADLAVTLTAGYFATMADFVFLLLLLKGSSDGVLRPLLTGTTKIDIENIWNHYKTIITATGDGNRNWKDQERVSEGTEPFCGIVNFVSNSSTKDPDGTASDVVLTINSPLLLALIKTFPDCAQGQSYNANRDDEKCASYLSSMLRQVLRYTLGFRAHCQRGAGASGRPAAQTKSILFHSVILDSRQAEAMQEYHVPRLDALVTYLASLTKQGAVLDAIRHPGITLSLSDWGLVGDSDLPAPSEVPLRQLVCSAARGQLHHKNDHSRSGPPGTVLKSSASLTPFMNSGLTFLSLFSEEGFTMSSACSCPSRLSQDNDDHHHFGSFSSYLRSLSLEKAPLCLTASAGRGGPGTVRYSPPQALVDYWQQLSVEAVPILVYDHHAGSPINEDRKHSTAHGGASFSFELRRMIYNNSAAAASAGSSHERSVGGPNIAPGRARDAIYELCGLSTSYGSYIAPPAVGPTEQSDTANAGAISGKGHAAGAGKGQNRKNGPKGGPQKKRNTDHTEGDSCEKKDNAQSAEGRDIKGHRGKINKKRHRE